MSCVCVLSLVLSTFTMGVSALSADVDDSVFEDLEMQALFIQSGSDIFSDLNEDYLEWWWEGDVPELDTYCTAASINMRGFDISADGRYMYCGTLNGGSGVRGVVVLDTATGKVTDLYAKYDGEAGLEGSPFSYAKGISTDDRGYVYVGFAFSHNYNVVNLGIAKQQADGTLGEVSFDAVYAFGDPGDQGGIKVGVNGVDVVKIGDKYYCYVMTNYTHDALYCLDVTDPENPKLNKDFGNDGVIEFNYDDCPVVGSGFTLDEGQYMDVDDDGVIWLVVNAKEGKDGIMRIAPDGQSCLGVVEASGAYCVEHEGNYLLVGAKSAKTLTVLDDASYDVIATITMPEGYGDRISRIRVIDDILYVCHNGNDTNMQNTIMVAPLTSDAQLLIEQKAAALTPEEETQGETGEMMDTEATPLDTQTGEPQVSQPADTASQTDAETISAEDETDASAPQTTTADGGAETGCGSVVMVGLALPMLTCLAFVWRRKKED